MRVFVTCTAIKRRDQTGRQGMFVARTLHFTFDNRLEPRTISLKRRWFQLDLASRLTNTNLLRVLRKR